MARQVVSECMPYAAQIRIVQSSNDLHRRRGVWHTPWVAWFLQSNAVICDAVLAVAYRAYAMRPYNFRKTNTAKNTFDVVKTMSDVEKITSDIIQTTSDLFLSFANLWEKETYAVCVKSMITFCNSFFCRKTAVSFLPW